MLVSSLCPVTGISYEVAGPFDWEYMLHPIMRNIGLEQMVLSLSVEKTERSLHRLSLAFLHVIPGGKSDILMYTSSNIAIW